MSNKETRNKATDTAPEKVKRFGQRRTWAWLLAIILLYTLSGFFLVPVLLNKLVVDTVRKDLGREASIQKIHFNPFQLTLKAQGFELKDTDGETLAGFDQLFLNFQVSSLFKWTWTFREISLDGLDLLIERFEPGDSRLSRLLGDIRSSRQQSTPGTTESGGLPRLLVQALHFRDGQIQLRDHVPADPVALDVGPVNISIEALNTLPDRFGQQTVAIQFPGEASLEWQGSLDLGPFQSEGTLVIRNVQLEPATAYLKALLPLESMSAALAISTDYQLNEQPDGSLDFALDNLQVQLSGISVSGLAPVSEFLSISALGFSGGQLRYPEKTLTFSGAEISDPAIKASLDANRQLNLVQLRPSDTSVSEGVDADQGSGGPWSLEIGRLQLTDGAVHLTDQGLSPPASVSITGLQLTADGISNQPGRNVPLRLAGQLDQGGSFEIEGDTVLLPKVTFNGNTGLEGIPLAMAQPWLQQRSALSVEGGLLAAQIEIGLDQAAALSLGGSTVITELAISDTRTDESLLAWQQLEIDRFEWVAGENNVRLSLLSFDGPYGRFRINEDRSTNLSGLLNTGEQQTVVEEPEDKNQPSILVGGISVKDGILDFADLSLPLQFAAKISDMDGSISTIDTSSVEPANIRLEGQVDEFGLARIEGSMAVFDPIGNTDVSVEFRNLQMSSLSPYTVKFAGREIDEGKLDLDLGYSIKQGKLDSTNTVVLSDLALGDAVESPDAARLPLDPAVALLKDSDGIIRIDLPVTGDVNQPEFKISGVVMQAITTVLTKIVSAPFRMLGSLIGIDSEDLGQFQFLAGRSDLTPPELEKITQLQTALLQRPQLRVEISGPYDPAIDVPKLRYFKLRDEVLNRLGQQAADEDEEIEMLDDEIRSVLEDLFKERFPQTPLDSVKNEHRTESSGLDDLAYAGDLRDRLLASENIATAELESLAGERAEAIREAFLAGGEFSENRISLAAPVKVESGDNEWVVIELGVATE